jgi:ribosome-associated translation inhibitor RaiA
METPLQITFRGFAHRPDLDALIRTRVAELEKEAGHRLTSCHVVVQYKHDHADGAHLFHVQVDVTIAGAVIIVNHDPRNDHAHADPYLAIDDAFNASHRRLTHVDHGRHLSS